MWTVAVWFLIFMYAINGMVIAVDNAFPSVTLVEPFTNSTLTPAVQPNVTATLENTTNLNAVNATDPGDTISFWDAGNYVWNQTYWLFSLVTGGFVFQALSTWGMPTDFMNIFHGIFTIFAVMTAVHFLRNIF